MDITKIGHCCLLIKDGDTTILTDPGAWPTDQNALTGIDYIVITHEHFDHFHIDSIKQVLARNPRASIITNSDVARLLAADNLTATTLEDGQTSTFGHIELSAYGTDHAVIHPELPIIMNTGYLFNSTFFMPGDAFTNPGLPVPVLAMPMIAPWMKLVESLDWVRQLQPQTCIPVHDGMLRDRSWIYTFPARYLHDHGIAFHSLEPGQTQKFPT